MKTVDFRKDKALGRSLAIAVAVATDMGQFSVANQLIAASEPMQADNFSLRLTKLNTGLSLGVFDVAEALYSADFSEEERQTPIMKVIGATLHFVFLRNREARDLLAEVIDGGEPEMVERAKALMAEIPV